MLHNTGSRESSTFLLSRAELVLIAITMVWGATFLIIHIAMRYSGPLFFVGLRFLAAGGAATLLFRPAFRSITKHEIVAGTAIGGMIFLGYSLQTAGLATIASSQSAFITSLYVPMVPVLQLVVLRRAPHPMSWAGVVLAFAGLILLAGPNAGTLSLSIGELLTLVGAMAIATEIILIGRYAGEVDSRRVTIIQLFVAGILAFCAMPVMGEAVPAFSWVWVASGVGLGIASAIMQLGMNWAQRTISPTRATVIYAGEPVWGGLVGRIAGDQLPSLAVAGAGLIISGVLVSEWRPKILQNRLKKKSQPEPVE